MSIHGILHGLFLDGAPYLIGDPGDAGEMTPVIDRQNAMFELTTSASGETRTLGRPKFTGQRVGIVLKTDGGGDCVITVTGGIDQAGSTTITFGDAGDWIVLEGRATSTTTFEWGVVTYDGCTGPALEIATLDVDTLTVDTLATAAALTTTGATTMGTAATTVTAAGIGAKNGATVTAVEGGNDILHKTVLTLASTPVVLTDDVGAIAWGGTKIYDLPEGAILFMGATADLDLALNAAGGVNSDWDGDFGLGTAIAANDNTLSSTEDDLLPSTAYPQAVNNACLNCQGQSTAAENVVFDGTGTAKDVYLNILVDDADQDVTNTATSILVSGTVTLHWMNLGNYTA